MNQSPRNKALYVAKQNPICDMCVYLFNRPLRRTEVFLFSYCWNVFSSGMIGLGENR